jgi:hypothetical protein
MATRNLSQVNGDAPAVVKLELQFELPDRLG